MNQSSADIVQRLFMSFDLWFVPNSFVVVYLLFDEYENGNSIYFVIEIFSYYYINIWAGTRLYCKKATVSWEFTSSAKKTFLEYSNEYCIVSEWSCESYLMLLK